ncbi:MAG TPA: hypothetical protein VGK19_14370 [Capsulimonadaceae bacterium]|jgi:hypothetical protein
MGNNVSHWGKYSKVAVVVAIALFIGCDTCYSARAPLPGRPLNANERASIAAAVMLLTERDCKEWARAVIELQRGASVRVALPQDIYIATEEKNDGTPYAYTLPDESPRKRGAKSVRPIAIVLAPRFFTATPASQAALLVHECAHWRAYLIRGASDEYDGYKAEYDAAMKIGLDESDGLPYFSLIDGVVENVIKRNPEYRDKANVKAYMAN